MSEPDSPDSHLGSGRQGVRSVPEQSPGPAMDLNQSGDETQETPEKEEVEEQEEVDKPQIQLRKGTTLVSDRVQAQRHSVMSRVLLHSEVTQWASEDIRINNSLCGVKS